MKRPATPALAGGARETAKGAKFNGFSFVFFSSDTGTVHVRVSPALAGTPVLAPMGGARGCKCRRHKHADSSREA